MNKEKKGILYIECLSGAAGDMLTAALYELVTDKEKMAEKLNGILPDVSFDFLSESKCGINGTRSRVLIGGIEEAVGHEHDHIHRGMKEIEEIVSAMDVSDKVKDDVLNIYMLIAAAESRAHGAEVSKIHFHEVGMMDAIADIMAICILLEELAPEKIIASPICTGFGHVHCAHGILPVPAPATAFLLEGIPAYGGQTEGELCTPTGAAVIKYFADEFGSIPAIQIEKIGYGMGKKDLPIANCVRILLGTEFETEDVRIKSKNISKENTEDEDIGFKYEDIICELSLNIDDMTAEEIAFAAERIFDAGARDVFSVPATMKKSRPGTLLCIICDEEKKEKIIETIFAHTTTLGIREHISKRYVLKRETETVQTKLGDVRIKKASGYGAEKAKFEYDDLSAIAKENNMTLEDVRGVLKKDK